MEGSVGEGEEEEEDLIGDAELTGAGEGGGGWGDVLPEGEDEGVGEAGGCF